MLMGLVKADDVGLGGVNGAGSEVWSKDSSLGGGYWQDVSFREVWPLHDISVLSTSIIVLSTNAGECWETKFDV